MIQESLTWAKLVRVGGEKLTFTKMMIIIWVVVSNIFGIFTLTWGNDPILPIFFEWVGSTTN